MFQEHKVLLKDGIYTVVYWLNQEECDYYRLELNHKWIDMAFEELPRETARAIIEGVELYIHYKKEDVIKRFPFMPQKYLLHSTSLGYFAGYAPTEMHWKKDNDVPLRDFQTIMCDYRNAREANIHDVIIEPKVYTVQDLGKECKKCRSYKGDLFGACRSCWVNDKLKGIKR